jgi:hypothetical protein
VHQALSFSGSLVQAHPLSACIHGRAHHVQERAHALIVRCNEAPLLSSRRAQALGDPVPPVLNIPHNFRYNAPSKNWVNAIGRWRMILCCHFTINLGTVCVLHVLCGTCRPRSQRNADGRSSITAPKRTCVHRTSLLFNELFQHMIQFSGHIPLLEACTNKAEPAYGRNDWPCTVTSRCRTVMISPGTR